jgi:nitroreductase
MSSPFAREALRAMDLPLLRAVLRERTHHTFEYALYRALFGTGRLPAGAVAKIEELLALCRARGLADDLPDVRWARRLLELAKAVQRGERPEIGAEPPRPFPPADLRAVERVIFTRRSIRLWTEEPVPEELVRRVIEAGLWAPHACNLQNTRVIIIGRETGRRLLPGGETRGAAVYLVICRDRRIYDYYAGSVPEYNRGLDAGAAVQNMLLMAHALGLGAVWGTFDAATAQKIRAHFEVPETIELITYIGLGWPAEAHLPPGRLTVDDVVVARG